MSNLIEKIFCGIMESVQPPIKDKKGNAIDNAHEELRQKLSPELFRLHSDCIDDVTFDICDDINYYFAEGFKLGLLLGTECRK